MMKNLLPINSHRGMSKDNIYRGNKSKDNIYRGKKSKDNIYRGNKSKENIYRGNKSKDTTIYEDTQKNSNNQFMMESSTSSDSDFSIESATSRALSNISKKNKNPNFQDSRADLTLSHQQNEKTSSSLKTSVSIPPWKTTSDREFTKTKDLLYNLSTSSIADKSPTTIKLESIRNSLINYARTNNIYIHRYDFLSLLTTILLLCGKALHCVLHVNIALLPLYEILIHVVRFILEQIVLISETSSGQDKAKASIVFTVQAVALMLVTIFIYGSILFPIFVIGLSIFWKIGYFLLI